MNAAIIVAAGSSSRIGYDKLFVPVCGRAVLAWTLLAFDACPDITAVALVLGTANYTAGCALVSDLGCTKQYTFCTGGTRRQDSVRAGLEMLAEDYQYIAVHDGARMMVTPELISAGFAAAAHMADEAAGLGAVVAAVPVKDTIKVVAPDHSVIATPDRSTLWAVQTPQVFDAGLLRRVHGQHSAGSEMFTDDGALVERSGYPVQVYMGAYTNLKVTTIEDFRIAEALLRDRQQV